MVERAFWLVWEFFSLIGLLCFSVAVDGMVVVDCEVLAVVIMEFDFMVSKMNFAFMGCLCLGLVVIDWTSGRMVDMTDITLFFERSC